MGKEFRVSTIKDNSGHEYEFIGTLNGEVIGRSELLLDNNEAEFRIHIIPKYQNKGHGIKLTRFAVNYGFRVLKLNRIWLGFEEGNEGARKLYEKFFHYTTHRMEICITQQ